MFSIKPMYPRSGGEGLPTQKRQQTYTNKEPKQKPHIFGDPRGINTPGNERGGKSRGEGFVSNSCLGRCFPFLLLSAPLTYFSPPQTRVVYASDPPATLPGHHHPLDSTTTRQESDCPVKSGNRNEGNEKQRVRCQINLLTSNKFSKCQ